MEEKWDMVVAGAGPEGCSLAAKVASARVFASAGTRVSRLMRRYRHHLDTYSTGALSAWRGGLPCMR